MTSALSLVKVLDKYPLFTSAQFSLVTKHHSPYRNLILHRLLQKNLIFRIEKGKYTVHDDPLLVASHIIQPSYLTLWTALSFYGLTTQLPRDIFVAGKTWKRPLLFQGTKIRFVYQEPFGYIKTRYKGKEIFVADKEKLFIDIVDTGLVPLSELEELMPELDGLRVISYLLRMKNKSLTKRVGFLMQQYGLDTGTLEKQRDLNYVPLLRTRSRKGKKDKIWKIIDNSP